MKAIFLIFQGKSFQDILGQSGQVFLLKLIGVGLSYLLYFLISKKLGPSGVGYFQLCFQVTLTISATLSLGLNTSIVRFIGQMYSGDLKLSHLMLHIFYLGLSLITGLTTGIVFFKTVGISYISNFLGTENCYIIMGFILLGPFLIAGQINIEYLRGIMRINLSELFRSILPYGILIIFFKIMSFYYDLKIYQIIYFVAFSFLLVFIFSEAIILRKIIKQKIRFFAIKNAGLGMLKISFPMMFSNGINQLLLLLPLVFLNKFSSLNDVGIYTFSAKIASIVTVIILAVNAVVGPNIARLYWSKKFRKLQFYLNDVYKILVVIGLIPLMSVFLFKEQIFSLLGEEYVSGSDILEILLLGQLLNILTGPISLLMNMIGLQRTLGWLNLLALMLSLLGYYIIVPHYGALGVAWITVLSLAVTNVLGVYYVNKTKGISSITKKLK